MNWTAVAQMIQAFRPVSELEAQKLNELLKKSAQFLDPFEDPLFIDFGAHRWLAGAREEVYSDWLAWILEQIQLPRRIFILLLGETDQVLEAKCEKRLKVKRELGILDEEGLRRRTDLELIYGQQEAIVVEVKKGDADKVDLDQLQAQFQNKATFAYHILLAANGMQNDYAGFKLRKWEDVCLGLRRAVRGAELKSTIQAAMILAFVGAVEQNILGMPGNFAERYREKQLISTWERQRIQTYLLKAEANEDK